MTYTPQQNGKAERINRTLMDLVRSTINDTGLPKCLWAELTKTAAYIRNRTTNHHDETKTPYEIWTNKKPNVSHLKIIGCETYTHIPKEKRHSKLSDRAKKGYLVGYALFGRGYRIWIHNQNQIIESRDCIFNESLKYKAQQTEKENETQECQAEDSKIEFIYNGNEENKTQEEGSNSEIVQSNEEILEDQQSLEKLEIEETNKQEKQRKKKRTRKNNDNTNNSTRKHHMKLRDREKKCKNFCVYEVQDVSEPTSFQEAINCEDSDRWLEAMQNEIESLKHHQVWDLTPLPPGINPVKCKWIYKKKGDRFKARLVAKGFSQQKKINYDEVYAPVSSFETIKLLTAAAIEKNWIMDQYDVKTAYLHSNLDTTIFMEQPEGFAEKDTDILYCKLRKSLYGLKQSGRCWNEHFDSNLRKNGFKRNQIDPCVYKFETKEGNVILTVYVDDIFTMSENEIVREKVKTILNNCFDIRYIGLVNHLLGVEFKYSNNKEVTLTQSNYIDTLLERYGMQDATGISTPMEPRPDFLDDDEKEEDKDISDNLPFRELIGGLLYLSQRTRPDISFAVTRLAKYCSNYNRKHWNAAKRILRYLKSTKNYGITYKMTGDRLTAYSDADWASSTTDRRSTTGYIIMFAGAPVFWRSVKQSTVALSTMEAEYIALAECTREVTWIKNLLDTLDLERKKDGPTTIKCDNQATIAHAINFVDKSRTKHIDIKHHFIREKLLDGIIELKYIPTERNIADLLTKPLNCRIHGIHRKRMMDELHKGDAK